MGFVSKDTELIGKFKEALKLTNAITKGARGGETEKKYFRIKFGDVIFYKFLNRIGLTSAKSKTIKSVMVPKKFFADFLRGLFDGDGTFYSFWDTRWPNSFVFKLSIASASLVFIRWLKRRLTELYGVKGYIHKGDGVFNLEYMKGDTRKLFQAMYYKEGLLYFSMKYTKMVNAFEKDKSTGLIVLQKQRKSRGSSVVERKTEDLRVASSILAPGTNLCK